jgi:MFS transporter, ACS family, hexuronate transporter
MGRGFRWVICGLVFLAVAINYMDRQMFSQLIPFFEDDLKLGPTDLALINISFILPYGLAMVFVGQGIDGVGVRRGLTASYLLWNLASLAHAFVGSLFGFMGVRFLLGVGESGMFPAGIKTVADWFPRKERALATGIFNAGGNGGAVLAPILGVWLATAYGWRSCFLLTGSVGLFWLVLWLMVYRRPEEHPRVSPEELAYIHSDPEEVTPRLSFRQLLALKEVYGLGIAKAMTDAPFWFYLFWLPKMLNDEFHVSKLFMQVSLPVVYIVSDIGSIAGGWMSSHLINRGLPVGRARKLTMLTCALAVVPVVGVGGLIDHPPILGIPCVIWAIAVISLAMGGHQGWSSNLFTLVSDTVPKSTVAMAVGAINGFAMVGAAAMQVFVGWSVQATSSYTWPFVAAGSLYLLALGVLQIFMPRVEPAAVGKRASPFALATGIAVLLAAIGWLQYKVSVPPYASVDSYLAMRGREIQADGPATPGPAAKVGWMDAQWFRWPLDGGKTKVELIKFDTHGRPFVESKGAKAAKYSGPAAP